MGGTTVRENFVPDVDATVVSRLRDAGAVLLGKLNLSEGAAAGYNPARDVPLNPWNPGSMARHVIERIGRRDGCRFVLRGHRYGHRRIDSNPASANGVVGLKPTDGRVSRFGVLTMADSLDHVGPMARSVADVAIMFDAIAGRDPKDPTSLEAPAPQAFKDLAKDVRGVRIGFDRDYALKGIDGSQAAAIEAALEVLTGLGAQIVDVRLPDLASVVETWLAICGVEIVAAHAATYPARASEYGPYMQEFLAIGRACHPATTRGRARATCSADDAVDRRARVGRCGRRSRRWQSSVAHHTCASSRIAPGVPQGVVHRASPQRRVHDANGSRRRAGDLRAVWLLV